MMQIATHPDREAILAAASLLTRGAILEADTKIIAFAVLKRFVREQEALLQIGEGQKNISADNISSERFQAERAQGSQDCHSNEPQSVQSAVYSQKQIADLLSAGIVSASRHTVS